VGDQEQPVTQTTLKFMELYIRVLPLWNRYFPYTQPPPPPLYHYTNAAGLVGILDSGSLWASAIGHSNDPREIACAFDVARPILTELAAQPEFQKRNQHLLMSVLEQFFENPERPTQDGFAVSFCAKPDLLSQWRAYGDEGGFSLEIYPLARAFVPGPDSEAMNLVLLRSAVGSRIIVQKINYDPNEQQAEFRQRLIATSRLLDEVTEELPDADATAVVATLLTTSLIEWVYSVKDVAFTEEQEWRLICLPDIDHFYGGNTYKHYGAVKTRVRNGVIVPYVVLEPIEGLLPIKSVTCGPALHPNLTKKAVALALESKKYGSDVHQSRVPLRTSR
jgi:hypothetical protein